MNRRLRVLDLTDHLALQGARLYVGQGADVIRVQQGLDSSGDDAARLHWHAGKRVCLTDDVEAVVRLLLPEADVALESGPFGRLRTPAMRNAAPTEWDHVVHVVVTPFGMTGPRRDWLADDLVLTAAGGMAWLGGLPGQAPEPPPRQQAAQLAGAHAAIGAGLGLVSRLRTGRGQLVDISAQEAVAATIETGAIAWIHGQTVPGRTGGVYGHVAHRVFQAIDGYVAGGYSGSNRMWDDLLSWMADEGEADDLLDERWQDNSVRWAERPHVDEIVARFVAKRGVHAFADEARRRALPWAEVISPKDLVANPQLTSRDFFVEISCDNGPLLDVGFPYASPNLTRPVVLAPPLIVGQEVRWASSSSPSPDTVPRPPTRTSVTPDAEGPALAGIRVLDLTWVLAGPYVTKTLGDHGADIYKIESRHRQDPTRFTPGMRMRPGASPDESGYFLNFNRNKQSLALNLRHNQGPPLLRRLAQVVDVVVENFSPGVLAKWGLTYEELRELNPDIILVSMAGVGQTGPWRNAVTFADTLAAMSGLTSETAQGGRPPTGLSFGLGDMVAANSAVVAVLELLLAGTGGHVDLAQLEAMSAQLGPAVLEPQLEVASDPLPDASLPGVFRCLGEDRWVAVGDATDDQLAAAGRSLLGSSPPPARRTDLISALAHTCEGVSADQVAEILQRAGIAAYPVRDGRDLVEDDVQLASRGFYVELTHPLVGPVLHEGLVERLTSTPGRLSKPAPLLGEHTDDLLAQLLDLSSTDLDELRLQGVLE